MYVVICGGGKVGWNLARELIEKGNEVTLVEQDRRRYLIIEEELEHAVQYGDATELWVLERAGIQRADLVDRGHRRRRGQHPHLPDREGEVPLRAHDLPRQQPAQPPALRAAGHPARGVGDRPDPAPDRARGAAVRPRPPARPARPSAWRSSRSRSRRARPAASKMRGRHRAPRRLADHLRAAQRRGLRPEGRHGHRGRRRGAARARPGPRGGRSPSSSRPTASRPGA